MGLRVGRSGEGTGYLCVLPKVNASLLLAVRMGEECESVSGSVLSDSLQPHGCSLPGSSIHGILQVRTPEWFSIPF